MALRRRLLPALAAILVLASDPARAQAPTLEECRTQIRENPATPAVYYCVYRSVLAHGRRDEAAELLRLSFREHPRVYRIEMFLAWVERMAGEDGSDDLLRDAIDGMEATGDFHGVVYGGLELAYRLGEHGSFAEAESLLDRCARAAEMTADPSMEARVWVGQASLAERHSDYSQWLHLTLRAERVAFPDGPYDLRCAVLDNLGAAYWYLCRYEKAFDAFERAARIREQAHDFWWQAGSVYNMALCAGNLLREGLMETEEVMELLEKGRTLAIDSGNLKAEAEMTLLLGQHLAGEEALAHFDRAMAIARRQGLIQVEINALRSSGVAQGEMGPDLRESSRECFRRAEERARETGQYVLLGEALAAQARLKIRYGSRDEAIKANLDAIEQIEQIRGRQLEGTIRAQAFSRWAGVYYRLAGLLLEGSASSAEPEDEVALALQVMERFRARELLERIESPGRFPPDGHRSGLASDREQVVARIAEVQRTLSDARLDLPRRATARRELEELEVLESDLRDQLVRESPAFAEYYRPTIPGLLEIQALLAPDQALLSYQLSDGESSMSSPLDIGASWLILVTRDRARALALPSRRDLRGRVAVLEGLLSARNAPTSAAARASVRLYDDLLQGAMAELPGEIRSLVIIPDDVLFRCPFAGLRAAEDAPPIGGRFAISVVPSAAVWVHLKATPRPNRSGGGSSALIFFAPDIGEVDDVSSGPRSADPWAAGLRLAPLHHAEREARSLRRAAGRGTLLLSGSDASERALKEAPLGEFAIIDLVTHAVVDDEQPERSAILLAPDLDREDGFLQVREIPDLELDGQLVILSSCRSSSGRILGGEGAQSLARAFLEAGAGTVLASLWPLEDEEASILFGHFSEALGRGESVAGALRTAQGASIEAGMPAASWAGLAILGDGDLRPIPAGSNRRRVWLLIGVILMVSYGVFTFTKARRDPPAS